MLTVPPLSYEARVVLWTENPAFLRIYAVTNLGSDRERRWALGIGE